MVNKGRTLEPVGDGTRGFHTVGHPWRAAGEKADFWQGNILLLEAVEELVEVRTAKVSDGFQTRKETASRELLEVVLTDVLQKKEKTRTRR